MLFRRVKVITILLMVFMMSIGCSRRKEVSIEPKKETKTTAESLLLRKLFMSMYVEK